MMRKESPGRDQRTGGDSQNANTSSLGPDATVGDEARMTLDEVLLAAAVEYAEHHLKVFPLYGKVPAIPRAHPRYFLMPTGPCIEGLVRVPNPEYGCKGGCGQFGHGHYDATDDADIVRQWWSDPYRGCNIGARIPDSMLVIDIDPRHSGHWAWAFLEDQYGDFPECLTTISGRGDGGRHLYVRRPPGRLTTRNLGPGIELKTTTAVQAPSLHPGTAKPYRRIDGPVPAPPDWFMKLVIDRRPPPQPYRPGSSSSSGSLADDYCVSASWADILEPHGWQCRSYDPDEDGAVWLHPDATSACSATVRHGCLFVWSTSTVFEATCPDDPHGYTKFRAHALLNHCGDMSAAARAIRKQQR